MDRACSVTNSGNNFPEASLVMWTIRAKNTRNQAKKPLMGRKKRNIFLNLAIVLVLADWWELFSWMNQAPRRFGCKPVWGLCEICNVNKCIKCGPLRPSQEAWKLSMLPVCLFKIMMARGFMFDASIDSGCFVDVFSWMKPLRLNDFCCLVLQSCRFEQITWV